MTAEKQPLICCICNKPIPAKGSWKLGNNPEPYATEGRCCDRCDQEVVIPMRLVAMSKYKTGLRR